MKHDIASLRKEREQLMNELLDQKAVVLQLKQRVSLLHGQNLQLATLAQSGGTGGGGSTQVLAIRNTLVATLAQLKQMEDQVQSIPGLRNQIRDLERENEQLKEVEQKLVLQVPSELPEGVSALEYKTMSEENAKLKEANKEQAEEMEMVRKHVDAIANSCNSLHKRMDLFNSSRTSTQPLLERIKRLEMEKDTLCQEVLDLKLHGSPVTDIDTAHLMKEVASLQKERSSLQSKLEVRKLEDKQQKERLLLKLFEIEALNIKTSRFELEKQALGVEQVQVLQSDTERPSSASPVLGSADDVDDVTGDISPEAKVQLLRFKQLEVHIQESQALLKAFMADKAELEGRVADLSSQVEEKGVGELQNNLHESNEKLKLARERIEMLEDELKAKVTGSDRSGRALENTALKTKVAELQKEVKRLSEVERHSVLKEEKLVQLEDTQRTCEKLKSEKQKVEKKAKERRHRLHSVASDLAKSAQLVKNYQEQCGSLQEELSAAHEELESARRELASAKAQLEVKEVELQTTLKQHMGVGDSSQISGLQEKYDQLTQELETVNAHLTEQTQKLMNEEQNLEEVRRQLATTSNKEKDLKDENSRLRTRLSDAEEKCVRAVEEKETSLATIKQLENEVKRVRELEEKLSKVQQEKKTTLKEFDSLTTHVVSLEHTISQLESEKVSLQQKVDILSNEAPLLVQKMADLRVAKDEGERRIQTLLAEQEACSAKAQALEEKLKAAEAYSEDVKCKIELLQSDLEMSESELDQMKEEKKLDIEEMSKLKQEVVQVKEKLANESKEKIEIKKELAAAAERHKKLEVEKKEQSSVMEEMKKRQLALESEVKRTQTETIPQLQTELAKTVADLNQLTMDYSSRATHIAGLTSQLQLLEEEKRQVLQKLMSAERDLGLREQTMTSLRRQLSTKEAEFEQLTSAHTAALTRSHSISAEVKELKEEVHRSRSGESKSELTSLRTALQHREQQLLKSQEQLAIQIKEHESLRRKVEELTNQCMGLTATKDNLLRRLDSMEKLEMDYDRLKQKVAGGNSAILEMIEGVKVSAAEYMYIVQDDCNATKY